MKRPDISVIIPVANEAAALPECLARLSGAPNEIIIVDAGSEDGTSAVAERFGCRLLAHRRRHRARQMNLGAAEAHGRVLLFLHADTLLPPGALLKIIDAVGRRRVIGALLVAFALAIRWRQPREHKEHRARREIGPGEALGFGVFSMATNFTTLALVVPAAKEIASSDLELAGRAVVIAVLVMLASMPAWLPVALTAVAPGAAERGLLAIGDLIERRGRLLMVLVFAGLGLLLVVRGILRLSGA